MSFTSEMNINKENWIIDTNLALTAMSIIESSKFYLDDKQERINSVCIYIFMYISSVFPCGRRII